MKAQFTPFAIAKQGLASKQVKHSLFLAMVALAANTWAQQKSTGTATNNIDNTERTEKTATNIKETDLRVNKVKDVLPINTRIDKINDTFNAVPNLPVNNAFIKEDVTFKEITIDNVSGISPNNHPGENSPVEAINPLNIAQDENPGDSQPLVGNPGTPSIGGTGANRVTDIITKDEVQGFVQTYPNPASDGRVNVNVTDGRLNITEVRMMNALGAVMFANTPTVGATNVSINTANMPSGIYFLSVKTQFGEAVKRVVIKN